ncbi:MAG TPA: T9SS type A sorting domain-containing protein, partial [Cyclobacteriaceae bacterium]
FSNAGLEPGTGYNYVAYAFNGSGQSINYFTTSPLTGATITLPPAPLALEAGSALTNSFKAKWNEAKSATAYELDVSLTSAFDAFVTGYSAKVITGLEETVNGIESDKTYYYRIRAKNASGLSANSNSTSVTTLKDSNAQPLALGTPNFINSLTAKINVNLSGGSGTRVVKFFSRPIMATDYTQQEVQSTSSTYEITITPAMGDDFGLEFYFTASDGTTTAPIKTTSAYIYKPIAANEKSIQGLSSGGGIENYRIISIPYKLEDNTVLSVFGSLGNYDKSVWRIVHYQNGKNADYPTFTKIDQGLGYWFNSVNAADIKLGTGTVPPFNQESPFKMNLSKGWNQIGDPYPFDIDWDDVLAANAGKTVGKLNVYNPGGGVLTESNSLKVWSGGFVFADNEVTDFVFPVTLKNTAGGRKAQTNDIASSVLEDEEWFIPLTLSQGIVENNAIGVGMHPHALTGKDQFDAITVPRFFNYLEMSTQHNEFFAPQFSRDVVPTTDQFTWSFTVRSNLNTDGASLTWNPETFGNGTAQLILYDEAQQLFIDMRKVNNYRFELRTDRKFRVIYSANEKGWNPGITLLGKPFPNPAASVVTIPLVMKENSWVEVDIVDLNGKKIKTLARQEYAMGVHDLTWLCEDESLMRVATGMYLVHMKTGNGSPQTQKIVVK